MQLPSSIFSGKWNDGHCQGIAIDGSLELIADDQALLHGIEAGKAAAGQNVHFLDGQISQNLFLHLKGAGHILTVADHHFCIMTFLTALHQSG